jgi:hypothetical protein
MPKRLATRRYLLKIDTSYSKVDTHWRRGGIMKDAGMRIRVEQELRDAFVAACQRMDVPAAQVLRDHMKAVVEKAGKTQNKNQAKSS